MIVMEGASAHALYRPTLQKILINGDGVAVRGQETLELLDVATVVRQPWHHAHYVPGRRWNPWLALSEALWILAGRDDVKSLLPYNKRIATFSDDGISLYGAYGKRLAAQIPQAIKRLQDDPADRRCVLSIWRPEDLVAQTKDPPCNDLVMFKIRRHLLYMTVINRSNDLHWGLYAVNIPTFGILHDFVAAALGLAMGTQTHYSQSLHVYTEPKRWKITSAMRDAFDTPLPELPIHARAFTSRITYQHLMDDCNSILDGIPYTGRIPFLEFADDFLTQYRDHESYTECRNANQYQDWIQAARAWHDKE